MIEPNVQAIRQLNAQNKRIMFISNSSAKGRSHIVNRLADFQIKVPLENVHINLRKVYNSAFSTALYLKRHHPAIRRLLVIGSDNLLKELRVDGLETADCPTQESTTIQHFKNMIGGIDASIDAVIVGVDYAINFGKVALASLYIQKGKPLFATNKDQSILVAGYKLPGAGSCVTPI
jgi:ribonucleotide monophosphatase NagD (HAD superfamily)